MTADLLVEIQKDKSMYWARTERIARRFFGTRAPQNWSGERILWQTKRGPAILRETTYKSREWSPRPTTFSWRPSYPDFIVHTADEGLQDSLRQTEGALLRECIEHPAGWTEVWLAPTDSFSFSIR